MTYKYEIIDSNNGYPIRLSIHSVDDLKMHWHNVMEIVLILKGSVSVRVGEDKFVLRENDLILINSNEIHSTSKTNEDNIILTLQINTDHFSTYCPKFNKMIFDCKSFQYDEYNQDRFDIIRSYLAQIVWEINKQNNGYRFTVASIVQLLIAHLISNFEYTILDNGNTTDLNKDGKRIKEIIDYINQNFEEKITLKEISEKENISMHYLSHLIRDHIGMSFQEYLNYIRLDKATNLLLNTNKTITELSYESGFPSTKSFNILFKAVYNTTPTEYRKKMEDKDDTFNIQYKHIEEIKKKSYLDVDRNVAFEKLFTYLSLDENKDLENKMELVDNNEVFADFNDEGVHLEHYWKRLTTFGRASEGLRAAWQKQIKELQYDIGFEYIRFHGIFSDDMMVYNVHQDGSVAYNWSYVDELFDFFKSINIKPFVELGFMPSEIRSSDETMFWWKANISPPRDMHLWTDLVKEFIKHCINRYGLEEVESWYFEVWNEPDLEGVFWIGGKEKYFEFYKETVLAIKSISSNLKVGGPSITHQILEDDSWFEDFLLYCNSNNVPLDFVSLHIYLENFSSKKDAQDIISKIRMNENSPEYASIINSIKKSYYGKYHTYDTLKSIEDIINSKLPYVPELHITEWNVTSYCRNLISDTCFSATFIISNILKCIDMTDSIGYWTFTDIMEEAKAGISHFHGGFGLMNKDGLKKPSYIAYYLLSKLGDKIIKKSDEYIITRKGEDIQILAYNYVYFDNLFLGGDTSSLKNTQRYSVFEERPAQNITFNIDGIWGYYKVTKYKLDRENGSVVDEWINMNAPENMTEEELKYLSGKSTPKITVEFLDIYDNYKEKIHIPVHGVQFITLEKNKK